MRRRYLYNITAESELTYSRYRQGGIRPALTGLTLVTEGHFGHRHHSCSCS